MPRFLPTRNGSRQPHISGQSKIFFNKSSSSRDCCRRPVKWRIRIMEIIYKEVSLVAEIIAGSGSSMAVYKVSHMSRKARTLSASLTAIPVSPVSFFACHHLPLTSETSKISCFEKLISFASSGFASYEYIAFARYGYSVADVTSLPIGCCSDSPAAAVDV